MCHFDTVPESTVLRSFPVVACARTRACVRVSMSDKRQSWLCTMCGLMSNTPNTCILMNRCARFVHVCGPVRVCVEGHASVCVYLCPQQRNSTAGHTIRYTCHTSQHGQNDVNYKYIIDSCIYSCLLCLHWASYCSLFIFCSLSTLWFRYLFDLWMDSICKPRSWRACY